MSDTAATLRDAPADVLEKYELYKRVADGGNGTIDFGLSREKVRAYKHIARDPSFYSHVRRDLVAVKLPFGFPVARTAAWAEVQCLEVIRAAVETPGFSMFKDSFAEIVDADRKHDDVGECYWFVMRAVESGVTLNTLNLAFIDTSHIYKAMPIGLISHIFLKLGAALEFLQEELGLRHGDVKDFNVMIRENAANPEFPDPVLVDFGTAFKADVDTGPSKYDRRNFCRMIYVLTERHTDNEKVCGCPGKHPEGWKEFVQAMKDDRKKTSEKSMREILKTFKGRTLGYKNSMQAHEIIHVRHVLQTEVDVAMDEEGIEDSEIKLSIFQEK
ncbi:hypothetical protein K505DRAFT_333134 [Melanomma pulvis-pyrius CBS 109.77]|uniref:Protein kinase domain-containing protein n=1 Tax=Melanomma pulvis-pyrius CBS 109.77 TaxID=1314802 RepID=A0A6A6XR15_9PLEO|nr:hypothetical protein K505DRAFT_333134 [Melanomma pulvis-pyrius CBS 109.77]